MNDKLMFAWRSLAHAVVGSLVTWLALRGLNLPPEVTDALGAALFGAGIAVYASAVHWLETRPGAGLLARLARRVAQVLMLGATAVPRYSDPQPTGMAALRDRHPNLPPPPAV